MSKEILKIARQPWMPKYATHWCVDSPIDTLALNCFYKVENNEVYVPDGTKFRIWNESTAFKSSYSRFEYLCYSWQYVYEITEPQP